MNNKAIAVAGTALMDIIKPIDHYPKEGTLAELTEIEYSTGGALCNVLLGLNRLDPSIPLQAIGIIGKGDLGDRTMAKLMEAENCDFSRIKRKGSASFTDVFHSKLSNQRTFFHCKGANSLLTREDFDIEKLDCSIFYIGYMLLLDGLDTLNKEYGTELAHLLHDVKKAGIETCIDMVGEQSNRISTLAPFALKYTDYCVINEEEAARLTGIALRADDNKLLQDNFPKALEKIIDLGLGKWAIIHTPEYSFGMDREKNLYIQKSPKLAKGYIVGTVGAGDAFCSGVLYTAYNNGSLAEALEAGTAAAVSSLRSASATDGIEAIDIALNNLKLLY